MSPFFVIPVLISTTLAGLTGPSDAEVSARRAEDDALEAASRNPAYLSTETGFELSRWGMTEAQVLALYPTAQVASPEAISLSTLVDSKPATLDFGFVRGKLAQVTVGYPASTAPESDFVDLARQLAGRFGVATVQHDSRGEALSKLSDREARLNVAGFVDGFFLDPVQLAFASIDLSNTAKQIEQQRAQVLHAPATLDATWVGHQTRADLAAHPNAAVPVQLVYQSRALGWDYGQQQRAEEQAARRAVATTAL